MVNVELLKQTIEGTGIPIAVVCRRANIKRNTLYKKFENPTSFRADDIYNLTKALKLTEKERNAIFFAKDVDLKSQV